MTTMEAKGAVSTALQGINVVLGESGRTLFLPVLPKTLVSTVKQRLYEREKIPTQLQVLRIAPTGDGQQGKVLENDLSLEGQCIRSQSTIHLSLLVHACPTVLTCRIKLVLLLDGLDVFPMSQSTSLSVISVFTEVAHRGGADKVSLERKWTEVCQALHCAHWSSHVGVQLKQKFEDTGMQKIAQWFPEFVKEVLNFSSHEAGARQANLPSRAMTGLELELFPEQVEVHIRGELAPLLLTAEWDTLLRVVFFTLETLGYFNWGCMQLTNTASKRFVGGSKRKVIVLGAGLSGLSCALQLARFGHDVQVVEARQRVGGRVHSDLKTFSSPVDLGAMLITGVCGHPISVLTHQLRQKKYVLGEHCPIFSLGVALDAEVDQKVEQRFNAMLTNAAAMATSTKTIKAMTAMVNKEDDIKPEVKRKRGRTRKHGSKPPLAQGTHQAASLFAIPSKYSGLVWTTDSEEGNRSGGAWRVYLTRRDSGFRERVGGEFDSELDACLAHDCELEKRPRNLYADFHNQTRFPQDFTNCMESGETITKRQRELLESLHQDTAFASPPQLLAATTTEEVKFTTVTPYMTPRVDCTRDYSLMECMLEYEDPSLDKVTSEVAHLESIYLSWHFANLEYACASSLEHISNANWDQDDEHDWDGAHVLLPNGFGVVTEGMRRALQNMPNAQVTLGKPAKGIEYSSLSASIECHDGSRFEGDAVVCTASLGVLKDPIGLTFTPPLPDWKQGSINRLGFGNLNKIVFEFPTVFWDTALDIFGRVVHPQTGAARGECYMFWALNKANPESAILLALVAGDAAEEQEYRSDEACISRALAAIQETFPTVIPFPNPIASVVTSIHDRVFFAGEATCRDHPATTGGAMVSGLREASKIAGLFGRATSLVDEGDDAKLCAMLSKIHLATKLIQPVENGKVQVMGSLLQHLGTGQFNTMREIAQVQTELVYHTENWQHGVAIQILPPVVDRERAWRAKDISKRLPVHWTQDQRDRYLLERLAAPKTNWQEEVGFWV
ncbi:hypothetical protein BASA81_012380 [Batrachochytrium salamandrivorans]|nr:hypothetical protein BASA81_012380 [Batrachochytrium salamandrivorans]